MVAMLGVSQSVVPAATALEYKHAQTASRVRAPPSPGGSPPTTIASCAPRAATLLVVARSTPESAGPIRRQLLSSKVVRCSRVVITSPDGCRY